MIYNDFNGIKLSALGMGNMRLPVLKAVVALEVPTVISQLMTV